MEWISGNIFIRSNTLAQVGDKVDGHKHNFDHTTIVFKGAVHVRAVLPSGEIKERDFSAGSHFLVRKDVEHEITATEDNTIFWCVYSHTTAQGTISQEYDGWREAYV
jgi:quercetin dioxygenase-like cupin family protein